MASSSLDPGEIEVEAEYFAVQNNGEPSISTLQFRLTEVMNNRGFQTLISGRRVWEYAFRRQTPSPSLGWRIKDKIGLVDEFERKVEHDVEHLETTRNDQPYRLTFRFIRNTWGDGDEGFIIEAECVPALREKLDRLEGDFEGANPKSAVRTCKKELRDIATEVGLGTFREPHTPVENYQNTLNEYLRKRLQDYRYGHQVIHFADDADQALRHSLTRPALAAYFHGIEWAIIAFIEEEEDRDIIENESYGDGKRFTDLVDDLRETGQATQTTSSALETMNTERIWMAHHKDGHVSDIEVQRIKKRFEILLEELFI